MVWMYFDFHKERSAFCPIVGHAISKDYSERVYTAMHKIASERWVMDNRFNHLWVFFHDDAKLKDLLYEQGFGSYVMDGCQRSDFVFPNKDCPYCIAAVTIDDANALLRFAESEGTYYGEAPLFLRRERETKEDIEKVIKNQQAFAAWDGDRLMKTLFAHCAEIGKSYVHVSYETVNPNACYFWPKIFKLVIRSVRRCVNKDANDWNRSDKTIFHLIL